MRKKLFARKHASGAFWAGGQSQCFWLLMHLWRLPSSVAYKTQHQPPHRPTPPRRGEPLRPALFSENLIRRQNLMDRQHCSRSEIYLGNGV